MLRVTSRPVVGVCSAHFNIGMCGIKKCPTIIYRLRKYRDTGIPWYLVTTSIVDKFCKNSTVRIIWLSSAINVSDIICKLSASSRGYGIYFGLLMYHADDLLLIWSTYSDFYTEWVRFVRMRWSKLCHGESLLKISTAGRYTAVFSKPTVYNTVIPSLSIPRYFSDTGIPRIPTLTYSSIMVSGVSATS